jgi:hypothetical protein
MSMSKPILAAVLLLCGAATVHAQGPSDPDPTRARSRYSACPTAWATR